MDGIKIPRSLNINLIVTGAQRQAIGVQSLLESKNVLAVLGRVPAAPALTNAGGTIANNLNNVFLQLTSNKNEVLHDGLPLYLLDPKANGTGQLLMLNSVVIDWTKSVIVWASAAEALANKDLQIPLLVIYE